MNMSSVIRPVPDANNNLTALHMRISGQSILAFVNSQNLQNGKDPFVFQGLNPGGTEGAFGYTIPNLSLLRRSIL